jgi:hypothetical protein
MNPINTRSSNTYFSRKPSIFTALDGVYGPRQALVSDSIRLEQSGSIRLEQSTELMCVCVCVCVRLTHACLAICLQF